MDRDKRRGRPDTREALDLPVDSAVVRPVNRLRTRVLVSLCEAAITRHQDAIAVFKKGPGIQQFPVAVDDQAGILRQHRRYAEAVRKTFGQCAGADIDRQVAAARERVQPHVTESFGKPATGVIADQQNGGLRHRIVYIKRRWFGGGKERVIIVG